VCVESPPCIGHAMYALSQTRRVLVTIKKSRGGWCVLKGRGSFTSVTMHLLDALVSELLWG
jgi:hypothetical protein